MSRRWVINHAAADFNQAHTPAEAFDKVPRVHSCARGVTLSTYQLTKLEGRKLHHKQVLDDGRELYFYYEPACSELKAVVADLERVKTYTL